MFDLAVGDIAIYPQTGGAEGRIEHWSVSRFWSSVTYLHLTVFDSYSSLEIMDVQLARLLEVILNLSPRFRSSGVLVRVPFLCVS